MQQKKKERERERVRYHVVIICKPTSTQHGLRTPTRRRNGAKWARIHIIFAIIIQSKLIFKLFYCRTAKKVIHIFQKSDEKRQRVICYYS